MNIIITGASRGIGRETALQLSLNTENRIIAISRSETGLKSLKSASVNDNIDIITGSITDMVKSPQMLLKKVSEHFKSLDILINNAGFLSKSPFPDISNDVEDEIISTNFISPARLIRVLIPLMHKGSHVVNIGSMSGYQGSRKFSGLSLYGAAKAALMSLTESLAVEFHNEGISFNCISPGGVQTEMFENAFPGLTAPVDAGGMADFVAWFAVNGHKYFNGKILPVALSDPK